MKRIFALILTMILSLSLLPTVVSAQNNPTVTVSNANAQAGDRVKITVSVKNNPGIMCMQLKFGYDADVLKFEGATESDFKGITYGPPTKNPFITTWIDPLITENNTTDGVFVTLDFTVLDTAPNGKSEISVTYDADEVFNIAFDNVAFEVENGYVDINNPASNQQQDSVLKPDTSSGQTNSSQLTGNNITQKDDLSKPSINSSNSQDVVTDGSKDITTDNADSSDDNENNNKNSQNGWIIWVVIAAVVVLGCSFAIVIIKSKNK